MDMGPAALGLGLVFPVLLAIALALVVMTDANEWEFFAVRALLVAVALDVAGFATFWLWTKNQLDGPAIVLGAIIGALVLVGLAGAFRWTDYREGLAVAKLFPGGMPTPDLPPNCPMPPNAIAVFFGSNVAFSTQLPYTVLNIGGREMLSISRPKNKRALVVSTLRIFDDLGNIIVRIDSDGFWVAPNLRRNRPDKSTLVVFDRKDNETLRIEFLNQSALRVSGIFRDERGLLVRITDDALILPRNNTFRGSCFGGGATAITVG